jgi:hypothetical protein
MKVERALHARSLFSFSSPVKTHFYRALQSKSDARSDLGSWASWVLVGWCVCAKVFIWGCRIDEGGVLNRRRVMQIGVERG